MLVRCTVKDPVRSGLFFMGFLQHRVYYIFILLLYSSPFRLDGIPVRLDYNIIFIDSHYICFGSTRQ
jgi:hypothetical protein